MRYTILSLGFEPTFFVPIASTLHRHRSKLYTMYVASKIAQTNEELSELFGMDLTAIFPAIGARRFLHFHVDFSTRAPI